jgi:spore maturation protein CgeB
MANGALVMSEPVYNPSPFVSGEHFVSASLDEMPVAIERYLNDDDERARIARAGHQFVKSELTMQKSLDAIFQLIDGKLAE